jgi:FKBP-type peptidyl-prolyl cis-trans isomerase FklB
MARKMTLKCMTLVLVCLFTAQAYAGETPVLESQNDKTNYSIGVNVVRNYRQQGMEIDVDMVLKGMQDAMSGERLLMTEEELQKTMNTLQTELRRKQRQAVRIAAENDVKAGLAFLAENKAKEGVVTLTSGLQYKILREGKGRRPTESDTVEVHYRGTLIDGTEILNTYKAGQSATFKVTGTIAGLREALMLMHVGSKWQVFVPPQLAYGESGMGRFIRPNAALIYEVELLAIK